MYSCLIMFDKCLILDANTSPVLFREDKMAAIDEGHVSDRGCTFLCTFHIWRLVNSAIYEMNKEMYTLRHESSVVSRRVGTRASFVLDFLDNITGPSNDFSAMFTYFMLLY